MKNTPETLEDCAAQNSKKDISDIQNGLRYFGKFGKNLICAGQGISHNAQDFIAPIKEVIDAASFESLHDTTKKDYEVSDYRKEDINPM